jgi:hypothetical protein
VPSGRCPRNANARIKTACHKIKHGAADVAASP